MSEIWREGLAEVSVLVFPFLGGIEIDVDIRPVVRLRFGSHGIDDESKNCSAADDDECEGKRVHKGELLTESCPPSKQFVPRFMA